MLSVGSTVDGDDACSSLILLLIRKGLLTPWLPTRKTRVVNEPKTCAALLTLRSIYLAIGTRLAIRAVTLPTTLVSSTGAGYFLRKRSFLLRMVLCLPAEYLSGLNHTHDVCLGFWRSWRSGVSV